MVSVIVFIWATLKISIDWLIDWYMSMYGLYFFYMKFNYYMWVKVMKTLSK